MGQNYYSKVLSCCITSSVLLNLIIGHQVCQHVKSSIPEWNFNIVTKLSQPRSNLLWKGGFWIFFQNNSWNRGVVELTFAVHQFMALSGINSNRFICLSAECIFKYSRYFHFKSSSFVFVFFELVLVQNIISLFFISPPDVFKTSQSCWSWSFTFINSNFIATKCRST